MSIADAVIIVLVVINMLLTMAAIGNSNKS
jgi:hypothetical protein